MDGGSFEGRNLNRSIPLYKGHPAVRSVPGPRPGTRIPEQAAPDYELGKESSERLQRVNTGDPACLPIGYFLLNSLPTPGKSEPARPIPLKLGVVWKASPQSFGGRSASAVAFLAAKAVRVFCRRRLSTRINTAESATKARIRWALAIWALSSSMESAKIRPR